jgi:hypothetical protein
MDVFGADCARARLSNATDAAVAATPPNTPRREMTPSLMALLPDAVVAADRI